jgi:tetratricopeptide (TPR) repeat protein
MESVSINDLQDEITHLRNKVDRIDESKKSWTKDISTFISVAAFLFSFGTTIVSYKRANEQDIHNLKSELRTILQRLAALPKENMEIFTKYAADKNTVAILSGYVGQENLLLSKQANEVLKRLPSDQVSATDYSAVALALAQSRNYDEAIADFKHALAVATILDDEVNALRLLGGLEMTAGKADDARKHFQSALDIFSKYPGYDNFTKLSTNFLTELTWAQGEAVNRNMEAASQHMNGADQLVGGMPPGPQGDVFREQANQVRKVLFGPAQNSAQNPLLGPNSAVPPPILPPLGPVLPKSK